MKRFRKEFREYGYYFFILFALIVLFASDDSGFSQNDQTLDDRSTKEIELPKHPSNQLRNERSPYLLQHADNPVNWYPWGEEAFALARTEDKPIFLSIGYSTCHWCHVMEKESFEDSEVAQRLNETFICIKVDREERPDIDQFYMSVCQMLTGRGGWPLTIVMTPDKQPFYAATYLPKYSSYGRHGMMDLIPRVADIWKNRRAEVLRESERIIATLNRIVESKPETADAVMNDSIAEAAYEELQSRYDSVNGGFSDQPKFPTPHNLLFLLRYGYRTGYSKAITMVEKTLRKMYNGGINDHIGFGFHRYSTDARWLVPHFEKMLYDQALLVMAYSEVFQATGDRFYRRAAEEIITYVLRDMRSEEGGFYSAEDADSEGEEGKFYLWTTKEIRDVLDSEEAEIVIRAFNLTENGNFGDGIGTNILHMTSSLPEIATDNGITEDSLRRILWQARSKLLQARNQRVRPLRDDKILTDWNGLMIAALAYAGRAFAVPEYTQAAEKAADFCLATMRSNDGDLFHRYYSGQAGIAGHLDDYAALVWGLLELYESDFDSRYLLQALELNEMMIKRFRDEENGGFFFTSSGETETPVRLRDAYDGAIPSGNSIAMMNLLRLSRMTANPVYETEALKIVSAFASSLKNSPASSIYLLCALEFALNPSREVVLVGDLEASDLREMVSALNRQYFPHLTVVHKPIHDTDKIEQWMPHLADYTTIDGNATAYVCRRFVCHPPTTVPARMLELLR
jgi:hypothetical protein